MLSHIGTNFYVGMIILGIAIALRYYFNNRSGGGGRDWY